MCTPTLTAPTLAAGSQPRRPAADRPVAVQQRFRIDRELGRGGLGRVLEAFDTRRRRRVALKVPLAASSPAVVVRLLREAEITARLDHTGVVEVHDLGWLHSSVPFYSMDLVTGRSLRHLIDDAPRLSDRLALLPRLIELAEIVAYAHGLGLVHRDIKPSNVMVSDRGRAFLIDWGLAGELGELHPDDDDPAVLGTPTYMPPEQALGDGIDERADIYAIGATLYHLIAGFRPYRGGSSEQILVRLVDGPPPPLGSTQPAAPAELVAIAERAMARDPRDRFASAASLADSLKRLC